MAFGVRKNVEHGCFHLLLASAVPVPSIEIVELLVFNQKGRTRNFRIMHKPESSSFMQKLRQVAACTSFAVGLINCILCMHFGSINDAEPPVVLGV